MPLVIAVQVWSGVGVAVVIYLAGMQAIPPELYEVASIDGAGTWQRLRHVTYPLLAPSVTANTLLSVIGSLQSYQLIYVLTGPINPATQVLSLAIFTQGFGGAQGGTTLSQGYAAAISMVQFVIVMISRWGVGVPAATGDLAVSTLGPAAVTARDGRHQPTRRRARRAPRRRTGKIGLYALLVVVVLIYLFPLVFLVNTALK